MGVGKYTPNFILRGGAVQCIRNIHFFFLLILNVLSIVFRFIPSRALNSNRVKSNRTIA